MFEYYAGLEGIEKIFMIAAVIGGVFFALKTLLMFVGGDIDADGGDLEIGDSDTDFAALSIHGLSGFLMVFGLLGLVLHKENLQSTGISLAGATFGGWIMLWLIARIFALFRSAQSSGTLDVNNAVGQEGQVYLTIPAEGAGKVQVPVQNRLSTWAAVTDDGAELSTGTRVRVVSVSGSTLKVTRVG